MDDRLPTRAPARNPWIQGDLAQDQVPGIDTRTAARDAPGHPPTTAPHLSYLAAADLDPFDRMLLSADGTVTALLEACTGEPIATRTNRQAGPATLNTLLAATGRWWHPDPTLLELVPAERLIARRALLLGTRSEIPYVLAESLVAPDRLPTPLAERLTLEGTSIGRLLTGWSLETRRELLEITALRAGDASDHLSVEPGETLARRTYRIVIGQRTAVVVTEWLAPGRLAARTTRGQLEA